MGKRVVMRGVALLAGLALVLGLAGCNKDGASSLGDDLSRSLPDSLSDASGALPDEATSGVSGAGEDASNASPASDASGDADVSGDPAVSGPSAPGEEPLTAENAPAISVAVPAGVFNQYNEERYTDERAPWLELMDDGAGVFRLNSGMGAIGDATGTYTASGSSIVFTIDDLEVSTRFRGDDTTSLTFSILDADHLRYSGEAYGLTLNGDIFTREGAGPYDPAAAQSAASQAQDESTSLPADGSTAPADSTSGTPADTSASSSAAVDSTPADDSSAPLVIAPGDPPPSRVKVGDSFTLAGIDYETLACEPALFDIFRDEGGQSATLTAIEAGEAILSYAAAPEDGAAGVVGDYEITVAEEGGISPVLLIIVGAVALIAGSGATFVLLSNRRKKAAKGGEADEEGAAGEGGEDGNHKNSKEARDLQAAKKAERKAAKEAKAAQQVADKTAKAAAKAAGDAQKSAAKAAKAEEALAKAEAAYQLYREAEAAAAKAAREAKEAVHAAASKKGKADTDKKKGAASKGADQPESPSAKTPSAEPTPLEPEPGPASEPEAPPSAKEKPEKSAEPAPKFGANALTNPRKSTELNNE